MSTKKQRAIMGIALGIAVISAIWWLWIWRAGPDAEAEERANQQRIQAELPRPNESAPRNTPQATPR